MKKTILKGHIVVPNSDLAAVKEELPEHIELTKKEEGCLVFEVTQDENEINKFHVYEEFSSESAFAAHQQRVSSSNWGLITKNVERFYEITEIDE